MLTRAKRHVVCLSNTGIVSKRSYIIVKPFTASDKVATLVFFIQTGLQNSDGKIFDWGSIIIIIMFVY